jgi:hypothetical protein
MTAKATRWTVAIGAAVLLGLVAVRRDGMAQDASEPHLPDAPSVIGPLHRDANGNIEILNPTTEQGTGPNRCDKGTICVGPGQAYTRLADALAAARDGDTVEVVGGTYHETAALSAPNVTVRGIAGRPHVDCAGIRPSGDKACILLLGQGDTLENMEISGAQIPDNLGGNAACIRNGPNVSFTLRGIICHGSQNGILSDGGTIVIEESEFFDNGWNGYTHNVYFSGNCASVTVRGSEFHDARVGHEFKSRCAKTEITDSTFRSTKGSRDLDLPDGGDVLVYRSTLEKDVGAQSEEIIGFAAESCDHPGDMVLRDVRIINRGNEAFIHNFDKCDGHAIVLENVTFEGKPPIEVGNIIRR